MGRGLKSDSGVEGKVCISTGGLFSKGLVFGDVHDADKKILKVSKNSLTVKPYQNGESWTVKAEFNSNTECLASVDFRVDGKPNPPPVPLNAQVWGMASVALADNIPDKSAL